jgi:hypothetical protein
VEKIFEGMTCSLQIAKTVTTGISSTTLLDMAPYKKAAVLVMANKPLDATGSSGCITATVYESSTATWNGAVATAMTNYVQTVSCNSTTEGFIKIEVNDFGLSSNTTKRYIGVRVAAHTATDITCVVLRKNADNEPLQ